MGYREINEGVGYFMCCVVFHCIELFSISQITGSRVEIPAAGE